MDQPRIPNSVATVVGDILGSHYYSHRVIDTLFAEKGAPGDPPLASCADKCIAWLKRASADTTVDALRVLGAVLEDFIKTDILRSTRSAELMEKNRKRITDILAANGLTYHQGGRIMGGKAGIPTRSLETTLRSRDLVGLDIEFQRALETVETDPGAAITAACALTESLCKVYIGDENLTPPADLSVKPLWKVVQKHIGLDPAEIADEDLRRILSGLTSIVDGLGALRSHVGSAHGQGRKRYRAQPRHAHLAIHAAHTLAVFVLETWDARRAANTF